MRTWCLALVALCSLIWGAAIAQDAPPQPSPATATTTQAVPVPQAALTTTTQTTVVTPIPAPQTTPDAPGFSIAPPPTWVKPIDPDSVKIPPSSEVDGGVDYVLIDCQEIMQPDSRFAHYTRRLVNEQGLQDSSEIRSEYDPSYQTFTMNWLKIKRDGVWQDRLASEKFQVLHREENLDSQMLDGRYSVVCPLQDVRVGDEIDYAYTITGANPVFNGKFGYSFSTSWSSPVHLLSDQLTTAPGRKVFYKSHGPALEPTVTTNPDQSQTIVWRKEEVPAIYSESDTPSWYETYGWVQVSEFTSWKEVIDWGIATADMDAPLSQPLQDKIAEIAKACATPSEKALAVINFVQQDIRYLGIEMGPSSYRPTPPSQVFDHRFGDCKDKTLLATVMLRALGIEAYPAFINTGYRQDTDKLLPSPLAFDHVIVQLTVDGQTYWIDLTRSGQRGNKLADYYVSDFRQTLVLKPGNDALSPMTQSPQSLPRDTIQETYTVKSVKEPVSFKIHTVLQGRAADTARSTFAESTSEKIAKGYLDYYARHFHGIKVVKPLHYQDFPEDNRFETWEEYTLSDFWTRSSSTVPWKAVFTPYSVLDAIGNIPSPQRKAPYALAYPQDITEEIKVEMFEPWKINTPPIEVTTPYFSYIDSSSLEGNNVFFKYHYKILASDVPAENMVDYRDQIKKVSDELSYNLTYMPPQDAPAASREPFRLNWLTITIAGLVFATASFLAYQIYCSRRPFPPVPLMPDLAPYQGIRGWLILVLIGLIFRLGVYLKALIFDQTVTFDANRWNNLTLPSSSAYDAMWAPTLLFELSFEIIFVVFSILALILMFQKRMLFPKVMIALFTSILVFKFVDLVMAYQIPFWVKMQKGQVDPDIARVVWQSVIWIPYFFFSKRVKATFRF